VSPPLVDGVAAPGCSATAASAATAVQIVVAQNTTAPEIPLGGKLVPLPMLSLLLDLDGDEPGGPGRGQQRADDPAPDHLLCGEPGTQQDAQHDQREREAAGHPAGRPR
jgi:hypothetical protein